MSHHDHGHNNWRDLNWMAQERAELLDNNDVRSAAWLLSQDYQRMRPDEFRRLVDQTNRAEWNGYGADLVLIPDRSIQPFRYDGDRFDVCVRGFVPTYDRWRGGMTWQQVTIPVGKVFYPADDWNRRPPPPRYYPMR